LQPLAGNTAEFALIIKKNVRDAVTTKGILHGANVNSTCVFQIIALSIVGFVETFHVIFKLDTLTPTTLTGKETL
jgi:hypothetical protein